MTRIPLFALLLGCPAGKDSGTDTVGLETGEPVDADGDGYSSAEDCDDSNAAIHPDADETCDEVDQDCDGVVDEDPTDGRSYYYDADGDDYGDPDTRVVACGYSDGVVGGGSDCDDGDPTVNPGEDEICDGVDQDCDGVVDEGTVYLDEDGDGFGDPDAPVNWCEAPASAVSDASDCDDGDADVYPGASETWYDGVDGDCAGDSDYDADGDGDDSDLYGGQDCDDADPESYIGELDEVALGASPSCGGLEVAAMVVGEAAGDEAGQYLSGGDVNGDGIGDLLTSGGDSTYLVLGPISGEVGLSEAETQITGTSALQSSGGLVLADPDLDGDGYGDLVIDSADADGYRTMSAFFGPVSGDADVDDADGTWEIVEYPIRSAQWAGDTDGDGLGDVIMSWQQDPDGYTYSYGGALLITGPWTGNHDSVEASAVITDDSDGDGCTAQSLGVGDLNADGLGDVAVNCAGSQGTSLFDGPLSGAVTRSDANVVLTVDWDWHLTEAAGDLDSDGYEDLLVNTPRNRAQALTDRWYGWVWVVTGPVTRSDIVDSIAVSYLIGEDEDSAASTYSRAGDLDADGTEDILLQSFSATASNTLNVWFVSGAEAVGCGACEIDDSMWVLYGRMDETTLGTAAASLGDQSSDGYDDIAMGGMARSSSAFEDGAVWIVDGGQP